MAVEKQAKGELPEIKGYAVLSTEVEREALKKSTVRVIEWARAHKVQTIVAGGFSAKPAVTFLMYVWDRLHPGEEKPRVFSLGDIAKREDAALVIEKSMPALVERLHNPLLIFEEHAVTGATIKRDRETLREVARKNSISSRIHTGALFRIIQKGKKPAELSVYGMETANILQSPSWATERGAIMDAVKFGEWTREEVKDELAVFRQLDTELKRLAGEIKK